MAKANGKFIMFLIVVFGYLLHLNNKARSINGFESWYSDANLITAGSIYYVIFFALITGFAVARVLKK